MGPNYNPLIAALMAWVFFMIVFAAFDAWGDTEFDKRANGYTGYDYDRGDWIEVDEDPTGGYDVYDYDSREYSDIEPDPTGGFTIYGGHDGE